MLMKTTAAWRLSLMTVMVVGSVCMGAPRLEAAPEALRLPKRLILCLDGTWAGAYNEVERRENDEAGHPLLKPANPLKLCRSVLPFDEETGRVQVSYYGTGVGARDVYPGTSNRLLERADRILGGGWGAGFEENVEHALHFLVLNFEAGDEVFIVGFSRGAATARAITRFLDWNHGLPRKGDAYYLPILFREYVKSRGDARKYDEILNDINKQRAHVSGGGGGNAPLGTFRRVAVKYLGVWDTVVSLGSRFSATGKSTASPGRSFYAGTMPGECVAYARQALAIDERRFDFRPEMWEGARAGQTMEQRWFAGVHANIGGGYRRDGLANIAFHWILGGAIAQGLKIEKGFVAPYVEYHADTLYESYSAKYWLADAIRGRLGRGRRALPPDAILDSSVIERMNMDPSGLKDEDGKPLGQPYRPKNVIQFLAEQPDLEGYLKRIGVPDGTGLLPQDVKAAIEGLRDTVKR